MIEDREKRGSSDPLPYLRVDRAATPLASALATWMSVTQQHALGSLVIFWRLCADPRDLERLVLAGKTDFVIDADRLLLLFEIASGKKVPLDVLLALGVAAVTDEAGQYRVRGMSRNIEPIAERIRRKHVGVAGGKASAAARKRATGSAQPRSGPGSTNVRTTPEPGVQQTFDGPEQTLNHSRTSAEPAPNLEVRDQRSESLEATTLSSGKPPDPVEPEPPAPVELPPPPPAPEPEPPPVPDRPAGLNQKHAITLVPRKAKADDGSEAEVFAYWQAKLNHPQALFSDERRKAVRGRLREGRTVGELKLAIDGCALDPFSMGQNDRGKRFDDLELICRNAGKVEDFMRCATDPPKPGARKGAATEADKDWSKPQKTTPDGQLAI